MDQQPGEKEWCMSWKLKSNANILMILSQMLQLPQILGPSALSCPQARKILKTLAQKWLQCVFESLFNWKEQNILSGVNESCRYFSTKLGPIDASRVAGQFVLKWWYLFKGDYIWAFLYKRKIVYILYCAMLRSASTLTNSVNFAKWRKAPIGSGQPINIQVAFIIIHFDL